MQKRWMCLAMMLTLSAGSHAQGSVIVFPPAPHYKDWGAWAALPQKPDPADRVPSRKLQDRQAEAQVDVFFVHPTIFTYAPTGQYRWNGDVNDAALNQKVDESTILHQASVFNDAARIYAPRYRQAHLSAYFTDDKASARAAFDTAYHDVKTAFIYYLENFSEGRPFIIAGHSQGTQHARRLIAELIDGTALQKRFVTAYLVGMPVPANAFKAIVPCNAPNQTGCFNTWNTFIRDYEPDNLDSYYKDATCTNPLLWNTTELYAERNLSKGGLGPKFKPYKQGFTDAQSHCGILWINKPYVTGRAFIKTKNWHRADYNLFYFNIRHNARLRADTFMEHTRKGN